MPWKKNLCSLCLPFSTNLQQSSKLRCWTEWQHKTPHSVIYLYCNIFLHTLLTTWTPILLTDSAHEGVSWSSCLFSSCSVYRYMSMPSYSCHPTSYLASLRHRNTSHRSKWEAKDNTTIPIQPLWPSRMQLRSRKGGSGSCWRGSQISPAKGDSYPGSKHQDTAVPHQVLELSKFDFSKPYRPPRTLSTTSIVKSSTEVIRLS